MHSPKMKLKHLDYMLVDGCSIDHKTLPLHVGRGDMSRVKHTGEVKSESEICYFLYFILY